MLRMDMVFVIRHKVLVERRSIRSVARELGVSRNTVSKYLQTSEPARKPIVPRPRPVMDKVAQRIDEILSQWAGRLTPKQRLTGSRLHRQLVEEHYQVGITTVRDYLREKRRRMAEVFIPLIHHPGEGSVEARGKGLRLQHLTPVPRGNSLSGISSALLSEVEAAWQGRVQRDGRRCWDLWQEELAKLLPLPERPFEARKTVLVSVSSKSTVQIGAATYSVPSGWARLEATAYEEFLRQVLEAEMRSRQERTSARRLQEAHFPDIKTLDQLGPPFAGSPFP